MENTFADFENCFSDRQLSDFMRKVVTNALDGLPPGMMRQRAAGLLARGATAQLAQETSPAEAASALSPTLRQLKKGIYPLA